MRFLRLTISALGPYPGKETIDFSELEGLTLVFGNTGCGKTFLFDAVYTWVVTVLLAFVLTRYTDWDILKIYFCIQFIDVIKLVIGLLMLRSDFWARNVVNDAAEPQ